MAELVARRPRISIVVEGYNESRDLGSATDTIRALEQQDFPLEGIEVILIGSEEQVDVWNQEFAEQAKFHAIKAVAQGGANYYELKNGGAELATGDIIAFTDSDVRPGTTWVRAIVEGIENGADVVVGPSLFRQEGGLSSDSAIMRVAGAITWGWILGKRNRGTIPEVRGFMDHNVAMRSRVFRAHQYRTDFGRIIASPLLYRSLVNAGAQITVQPKQQAAHRFTWHYWLISLEFRFGHEVFRLRRLDRDYPNQWITRTSIFEPIVTAVWHMMLDIPRWFRYGSLLPSSVLYQVACLPLLIGLSSVAHVLEMLGMYATMVAPERMRRWAENV